jgi:tetrapyrrole methylase family protein/MazG family protein
LPLDREQTHLAQALFARRNLNCLALDRRRCSKRKEELGDVLLQVVFHSQIARRKPLPRSRDVIAILTDKLVRRHPYVSPANRCRKIRRRRKQRRSSKPTKKRGRQSNPPS